MSVPGKNEINDKPMQRECTWCHKKGNSAAMTDVIVLIVYETGDLTRQYILCVECMRISVTLKGLMWARETPGIGEVESHEPKD